jgi:predicted Zn-dependent protease
LASLRSTSESQLAAVLAHEIAHISQRHAAQQLSNAMVTNLGLSLLGHAGRTQCT